MIDSMLIISTSDTEEHSKPVVDEAVEAAFQLSGFTGLSFQAGTCNRIADYFAHGVARTPNNLRGHVQRINEHIRQKDSPGTYGALLDLFITLSDKGLHLRNRMLRSAKEILDPYRYQALSGVLQQGIKDTDRMPLAPNSVFSKGLTGCNQLVQRIESRESRKLDPLQMARDHIEYGQIDEAREILEQALLTDTGSIELHHELLEIYRCTCDKTRFSAMRQNLREVNNPAEDAWSSLEQAFEKVE